LAPEAKASVQNGTLRMSTAFIVLTLEHRSQNSQVIQPH
jgi:hypothetical protein